MEKSRGLKVILGDQNLVNGVKELNSLWKKKVTTLLDNAWLEIISTFLDNCTFF